MSCTTATDNGLPCCLTSDMLQPLSGVTYMAVMWCSDALASEQINDDDGGGDDDLSYRSLMA